MFKLKTQVFVSPRHTPEGPSAWQPYEVRETGMITTREMAMAQE